MEVLLAHPAVKYEYIANITEFKNSKSFVSIFRGVQDVKSTYLGMGQWRLKAETDFDHRIIAEDALRVHNMDELFKARTAILT